MKREKKKIGLTTKILLGLVIGFIFGCGLYFVPSGFLKDTLMVDGLLYLMGEVFLRAIKMLVVPLVFVSIVNGAANIGDIKKLGRIGGRTLSFYIVTTAIAISLALGMASIIDPGQNFDLSAAVETEVEIGESLPLVDVLLDMVPENPIAAMTNGNMLQIIVFALLIGVALSALGKKTKYVTDLFAQLNELMMKIVGYVMLLAPIGVFALISRTFASEGLGAIGPLIKYFGTVILVLIMHAFLTYGSILKLFTGLNITTFIRKFFPAISVGFSTASSSGTLPVSLEVAEKNLGISKNVSSFTLPLGATINMDGTAIMQGVATIFIAQVYGIELTFSQLLTVIITATLASIGTAGVPGVGLIMLSMVLQSINIPVEGIGLIMGIDRLLDMTRTAVNIVGDSVCTLIVAKKEGEFDESKFRQKENNFNGVAASNLDYQ
ncbi:dicarboxylate/amino acid:cation symporter [Clostridium sp. D2Q-14]|uniref:dicarboxylate/amino acid:cation symporter n=1 Tax=Anaeromonas gelatinilytica TaxID=2683194 RepID=UPI00193C64D9|nr:dicarboxylate/amino acid:cation symporter [Anaeromonas gelatinilytica]MBS4535031.1 dicarboxylate/amino acid:cation symporter [Anaeromonas gelatinilytica]